MVVLAGGLASLLPGGGPLIEIAKPVPVLVPVFLAPFRLEVLAGNWGGAEAEEILTFSFIGTRELWTRKRGPLHNN